LYYMHDVLESEKLRLVLDFLFLLEAKNITIVSVGHRHAINPP